VASPGQGLTGLPTTVEVATGKQMNDALTIMSLSCGSAEDDRDIQRADMADARPVTLQSAKNQIHRLNSRWSRGTNASRHQAARPDPPWLSCLRRHGVPQRADVARGH
jgi:hypothetical protein